MRYTTYSPAELQTLRTGCWKPRSICFAASRRTSYAAESVCCMEWIHTRPRKQSGRLVQLQSLRSHLSQHIHHAHSRSSSGAQLYQLPGSLPLRFLERPSLLLEVSKPERFPTRRSLMLLLSAWRWKSASITGNLPSAIWEFQLLTSLILTGNPNLTGPIPPFIIGSNIPHVSLNILDLHSNGLSGSIPDDLGPTLKALKELDLSNNQFNDTLPSSLSKMFILDTLKLSNNQLTSNFSNTPLSNVFYGWDSLLIVDLSRNNFQEPLPNFTHSILQTLNLSYNHFLPSTNFSWLKKLPKNLESISLSSTSLVGEMNLSKFNSFSNLTSM